MINGLSNLNVQQYSLTPLLLPRNKIFKEGNVSLISGVMGSGKTDFALLLGAIAKKQKKNVFTNIENNMFKLVVSDRELIRELYKHIREKNIVILDEANLFQSSKRATAKESIQLEMLLSTIRKLRAGIIFIIQRYLNLIPFIREMAICEIIKLSEKNALIRIPDIQKDVYIQINNIPPCRYAGIDYDTYAIASFTFELNLKKIYEDISKKQITWAKLIRTDFKGYELNSKK